MKSPQMTWDKALELEQQKISPVSCECNFDCPLHDELEGHDALLKAAKYTLNNLEAAAQEKLITAPRWFQVQLSESRKLLAEAIAKTGSL